MIEFKKATHHSENTYLPRAKSFDSYCAENHPDANCLTEPIVLGWLIPDTRNLDSDFHSKAAFARTFGRYLKAMGRDAFVFSESYTAGRRVFVPYLFSDEELKAIFREIDCPANSKTPFEALLFSTYFRLTYTCGLRPGEGRMLMRNDIDLDSGEIHIADSKWHKSRTVVMSDDMVALARQYAVSRDAHFPRNGYFFLKSTGMPYTAQNLHGKFKEFYALSQPSVPKDLLPAIRVYDLRHRFATAVLNRWLDKKVDIKSRLPYLQTYMGHKDLTSTAYYIHLLPENLVKSAGIDWDSMNNLLPEVELWQR